MPRVGFEPTTPVFKQEKTVHTSNLSAIVIAISRPVLLSNWEGGEDEVNQDESLYLCGMHPVALLTYTI
jgi:hypothetical protein